MIQAKFKKKSGKFSEFTISGHAGYAESGQDIVCASVSSAVMLTVNLLQKLGCSPEAYAEGDTVHCEAAENTDTASDVIGCLVQHLEEGILEEFPKTIKITISEV